MGSKVQIAEPNLSQTPFNESIINHDFNDQLLDYLYGQIFQMCRTALVIPTSREQLMAERSSAVFLWDIKNVVYSAELKEYMKWGVS